MLGLRHRVLASGVERGGKPQAAGDFARFVGQDVAVHIGGDDDIELARVTHQQRRHGVDDALVVGDVGVARSNRTHALEVKAVRYPQHIGFVHGGDFLAPPHGELERGLRDPRRALPRNLAHRQRQIRRRHEFAGTEMHGAVGIEAFRVLAHDDEIDGRAAAGRESRARPRGADIGVKVEPLAQFAGRIEAALGDGRILIMRDRAEQHSVRGLGYFKDRIRKRRAAGAMRGPADGSGLERELQAIGAIGRPEHGVCRRHDFRPNAVAFQHQQPHRASRSFLCRHAFNVRLGSSPIAAHAIANYAFCHKEKSVTGRNSKCRDFSLVSAWPQRPWR